MVERELTPEIVKSLGLDPSAGWTEISDESSLIRVIGECGQMTRCRLRREAIFNVDTGETECVECPDMNDPLSNQCALRGLRELPVVEK